MKYVPYALYAVASGLFCLMCISQTGISDEAAQWHKTIDESLLVLYPLLYGSQIYDKCWYLLCNNTVNT